MKLKKKTLLLGLFLSISIIGCNTGTTRDYTEEDWETARAWNLTNVDSELTISDYIVYDGGHSLQIVNGGCGDLELSEPFDILVEKEYELSIAFRRSPTGFDESTVEPHDDQEEPDDYRGENFTVIIKHPGFTPLINEEVEIESDFTWENKSFKYTTTRDEPLSLEFKLGCDLKRLWIDIFKLEYELKE